MEGYSHSHSRSHSRPQAASGPATLSGSNKKPPPFPSNGVNNGGFFATSYDDVFGGPPRYANLAPRAEDYSEIFGAFRSSSSSRASSIPVLDLPAVSDIDSADSVFDYSEVFGGFNDVDFAVNYDELFRPFDGGDCCSSDEAWTPVGTESLSDDSDPFALSEKSQNENYHKLSESKEFNVSFHKVNLGTNTCRPNITHVAQLNAVSGYTCVVDGTTSLREMGAESLGTEIVDDIVFSVDSSSIMPQKHKRKTMSELSLDDAGLKSFDGDRTCGRSHAANMPHVNSTLSSVPDINFSTEPSHFPLLSRIPPVGEERKGDISKLNLGFKASDNCALKATVDGRLPPCFDMELDASSSAAASAAAMKDAMEKAQAKLKAAKVLMDKKKDGVQDTSKLGLKTDLIGGKNAEMELNECATGDTRVQRASDRGPTKIKSSGKDRRAKTASQNLPDISAVEQPNVTRRPAEGKHGKKYSLSMDTAFIEGDGEWKEAIQYYEFVTNDDTRVASQPPSNGDVKTAVFKHQGNDDEHNSDSAGEACVPEGNRRRLKATKSVSRQDYYEKMVKVAQEVHERVIDGHVETGQSLTGVPQGNQREQKSKLGYEGEKNVREVGQVQRAEEEESGEVTRNEEVEIRSKNVLEEEEIKKKETEACHGVPTDRKTYCPHQSRVKEFSERKEEEVKDAVKLKNDKERREVKEKRSKEPLDGFGGDGLQTACESQENGKNKELERKVEDKRSKEAVVDTYDGERLQRTHETQENDERKDLLQRDEDENYVEVAVDGQGSETKPEECVELEEHRKYKEAPEQVIRRLKEDECHNLAAGDKISGEGPNEDDNEEILEKLIEQGTVENKPLQGGEMDEAVKILKKIVDPENQKVVNGSHIKIDWEDEDQESDSSTEIELPVCNEDLKSSNGANLHNKNGEVEQDTLTSKLESPQTEADGSQEVSARKENGQISTVASDDERKLKAVDTTDVLVDKKPTGSTRAQVGADENENERTVHSSESLDRYGNNSNSGEVCIRSGQKLKDEYMKVAQPACDPKLVKASNLEQAGRRRVLGGGHVHTDQEEKVKSTPGEGINGWNEHARKKEAAHTVMPETKENIQKRSHPPNISQSNERKGKIINQNFPSEEKTKEKERDLEKEQLRKLEEEREREREREKDRMAVEIAIREARERAFADARDRAERAALERATDKARQRAMAEARERLEKACAEARERSSADKVSDARLRAERAAVERATAEARQRAIEKTMADRATFEARERMQRSVSEKYTSERDVVMRQSSLPTMHSEKFEAGDGEPAERCKARLERHRRTVERVAKALAEKNMRDVLAQREQAERSRFAETLDADIKRWSNGKEGNLRALLSTLQYILGPDSGWQPIPLTEVITAAAVKKAYRKATLSVHPDKLQQRGATIQQKYICEKVFDLLKEAWNRFNSEEK